MKGFFEFTDYRTLLRLILDEKKVTDPQFSIARFAKKIGMSTSLLKMVLTGKRNLSATHLLKVSAALRLTFDETVYLEALLRENDADTEEERPCH